MNKRQARKLIETLLARGVMVAAQPLAKHRAKGERSIHGTSGIDGVWARTAQRNAPERDARIVCADVAEAMLDGWSVTALRSCSHGLAA